MAKKASSYNNTAFEIYNIYKNEKTQHFIYNIYNNKFSVWIENQAQLETKAITCIV